MSSRWRFLLLTFCALLALGATLALGRWQLSRAAQKEAAQARVEARAALPALGSTALAALPDASSELQRRVVLRGRWLTKHTVFLDNRQMNSKPGLYVITPLQLEGVAAVVLVQRGWVARNFIDRTGLPPIESPDGLVEIAGRLAAAPSKLYQFGEVETGLIRQNLDLAAFSAESGLPLLPVSVQQTGAASEGLLREWPGVNVGVETHYGYAAQWFALSALITALYVWFQIVKRFIKPRRI